MISEKVFNQSIEYLKNDFDISIYEYESFNNIEIYSRQKQIEIIQNEIDKFTRLTQQKFSLHIAYNYINYSLDEKNIFDTFLLECSNIKENTSFQEFKKTPEFKEFKTFYARSKYLELAIKKKKQYEKDGFNFNIEQVNQNKNEFLKDEVFNSKATEKLIMLEKMGVIDFLKQNKDFTTSTNLMAKFLSQITGEKASTLQPSLSAMLNKDLENKNNPLSRSKTVDRAIQKLASLGIKPIK